MTEAVGHRINACELHSHEKATARLQPIDANRLPLAKAAYTTRRISLTEATTLLDGDLKPEAGDLVLARIEEIRQQTRLELRTGRRAPLYKGDEIIVCYGHRYAPDQFEALVPPDLGPCELVAAGGIAGQVLSRHESKKPATQISPCGLLANAHGRRINLADWSLPKVTQPHARPVTVAVVGTSMNAGKTTTLACLTKGFRRAGCDVGAAKITGTGGGGDLWAMKDAGANPVADFIDAGFSSTFRASQDAIEGILTTLTGHLANADVDVILLEVADGLLQRETAGLLSSLVFRSNVDGVLFAAGDAMAASAGSAWLRQRRLNVLGLSGTLTASPLASREAEQATGVPVLAVKHLSDPNIATQLLEQLKSSTPIPKAVR
ncbi:MAG: DUF1611 domain-containing protein [Acidiferrobacterales bacterium]